MSETGIKRGRGNAMRLQSRVDRIAKRVIPPSRALPTPKEMNILLLLFVEEGAGEEAAIRVWKDRFAADPPLFMETVKAMWRAVIEQQTEINAPLSHDEIPYPKTQ